MDEKSRPLDEFTQNAQALTRAKFHKKEDGHMILEPHDFKSIDPATFSALKERYPIYNTLPRGPIPGNLEPLAKGLGPRAFKEQFEDTWASTNLAYAAAVRTYVQLEQLKEDKKPPSKKVLQDAAFAILTISNIQARALQQYKHHCARTVAPQYNEAKKQNQGSPWSWMKKNIFHNRPEVTNTMIRNYGNSWLRRNPNKRQRCDDVEVIDENDAPQDAPPRNNGCAPAVPDKKTEEQLKEEMYQTKLERIKDLVGRGMDPLVMVLDKEKDPEMENNAICYLWTQGMTNMDIKFDILEETNTIHVKIIQRHPRRGDLVQMFQTHGQGGPKQSQYKSALKDFNRFRLSGKGEPVVSEFAVTIPKGYHTIGHLELNTPRYVGFMFYATERSKKVEMTRVSSMDGDQEFFDMLSKPTTTVACPF